MNIIKLRDYENTPIYLFLDKKYAMNNINDNGPYLAHEIFAGFFWVILLSSLYTNKFLVSESYKKKRFLDLIIIFFSALLSFEKVRVRVSNMADPVLTAVNVRPLKIARYHGAFEGASKSMINKKRDLKSRNLEDDEYVRQYIQFHYQFQKSEV